MKEDSSWAKDTERNSTVHYFKQNKNNYWQKILSSEKYCLRMKAEIKTFSDKRK